MSRAKAKDDRQPSDQYLTPAWVIESLVNGNPLFHTLNTELPWLEPCAGTGNIILSTPSFINWHAIELDSKFQEDLHAVAESSKRVSLLACPQSFLTYDFKDQRYGAVVTNPPYSLAREFIEKSLTVSDHAIMLLRLNFLGSLRRQQFIEDNTPDFGVLYPRPKFFGGGSDATEYAWFHFHPGANGKYHVLPVGPHKAKSGFEC